MPTRREIEHEYAGRLGNTLIFCCIAFFILGLTCGYRKDVECPAVEVKCVCPVLPP